MSCRFAAAVKYQGYEILPDESVEELMRRGCELGDENMCDFHSHLRKMNNTQANERSRRLAFA